MRPINGKGETRGFDCCSSASTFPLLAQPIDRRADRNRGITSRDSGNEPAGGYPRYVARCNTLDDFPADAFTVVAFCDACGHSEPLDRAKVFGVLCVHEVMTRLRCSACGSGTPSIRIVHTAAGGFPETSCEIT